jgi:RNA polymerase sigma-70 factor, ECF subfamily
MAGDVRQELVALLPRLRRFAYTLAGSREEADDLVQAACERALARLGQYEPGTALASWMFRLIQTIWIDRCRYDGRRHTVSYEDVMESLAVDARIHEQTEARALLAIVRREVGKLSEDQRAVLALVVMEGLSYQEAADMLGVKIGTVMSRLARARLKLAAAIEAQESGSPNTQDQPA